MYFNIQFFILLYATFSVKAKFSFDFMKNTHTVAILRLVDPATTEISGTASKIGALSFTSLRFTYRRRIVFKINYLVQKIREITVHKTSDTTYCNCQRFGGFWIVFNQFSYKNLKT